MRSPTFGATSSRPFAVSVDAAYADQVPLERPGPTGMTVGGPREIYPTSTYGLNDMVPTRILPTMAREVVPVPRGPRPASGIFGRSRGVIAPSAGAEIPQSFIDSQLAGGATREMAGRIWSNMSASAQQAWIDSHSPGGGGVAGEQPTSKPDWYTGSLSDWQHLSPSERARLQSVHDSSETAQQTARLVETIVGATTGTVKEALDAYLSYNVNENALRLELARQETQRQLNAANAAAQQSPEALQRAAQLQAAMDQLSRFAQQNAALLATRNASQISTGTVVAIAATGIVVLGTIVFLATRPRSNPSRPRRTRKTR